MKANTKMEKYLLTIEFRYLDAPKHNNESSQYVSKTITLGVFDTRDEANLNGNKSLEILEKYCKLNPNYNKKERFSNNGGCFGYPNDLISNNRYLLSPFDFYAKITRLKYDDIEESITNAIDAVKRYKAFKDVESD